MDQSTIMDSEFILPDFSPDNNEDSNPKDEINLRIPLNPNTNDEMDTGVKIKEEEVEVGELFVGRSIDENIQTVFLSGLILIHDQPTMTVTATASRTETHLLLCTPVYNDEKGTPSYLQTSTPSSSIIRTNNHSEIQFVQHAIQVKPSGSVTISERSINSAPKDPLEISPPKGNHEIQRNPAGEVTIKKHFVCTLCGIFVERNEDELGVHECISNTVNLNLTLTSCHVNISTPTNTNQQIIDVHEERKVLSSQTAGSNVEGESREERRRRRRAETERRYHARKLQKETPEDKRARLAAHAKWKRDRRAKETEEERKARLAANAEQRRKYFSKVASEQSNVGNLQHKKKRLAHETPEQRIKRIAAQGEGNKKRLAKETPEQRTKRLAEKNAKRRKKRLGDEDEISRQSARLADPLQCEYCQKFLVSKMTLRNHMIREHSKSEDKKFKCDHCEKTFAMQGDCRTHVLTHSMEKCFICDECGKGYKSKKGLKYHINFKHRFDVQQNTGKNESSLPNCLKNVY